MVHRRTPSGTLYEEDEDLGARVERSVRLRVVLRLARLLLASTLWENAVRVLYENQGQTKLAARVLPALVAGPYVHFCWVTQLVGGTLLALGVESAVAPATCLAYLVPALAVYGSLDPVFHGKVKYGRTTYVCRTLCIIGGVLASHAHSVAVAARRNQSVLYASTGKLTRTEYGILVARVLGAASSVSHIARIFAESDSVWIDAAAVAYALFSVALAVGFTSEVAAIVLAFIVLLQNLVADRWYLAVLLAKPESTPAREGFRRKKLYTLRFYLFQDLAVFGALLLLALLGPGRASLDRALRKRRV